MSTGIGATGKVIAAGDQVTILGTVSAISGTGPNASVTVQPVTGGSTFNAKASDCYAAQTDGVAISADGKGFGVGAQVSVPAVCTAVSGSGNGATLTSTLNSGASVPHPSTSANHPHAH